MLLTEHSHWSEVDTASNGLGGGGLLRRASGGRCPARGGFTRIWIEQRGSDGSVKPFRAFQLADGKAVELFEWALSGTEHAQDQIVWGGREADPG